MLAGLSELTSDPRPEVRSCAVEVLSDLPHGARPQVQHALLGVCSSASCSPSSTTCATRVGGEPGPADLWLRDTSIHCLHLLCDLFCHFYEVRPAVHLCDLWHRDTSLPSTACTSSATSTGHAAENAAERASSGSPL